MPKPKPISKQTPTAILLSILRDSVNIGTMVSLLLVDKQQQTSYSLFIYL